jgi:hypothetical protein
MWHCVSLVTLDDEFLSRVCACEPQVSPVEFPLVFYFHVVNITVIIYKVYQTIVENKDSYFRAQNLLQILLMLSFIVADNVAGKMCIICVLTFVQYNLNKSSFFIATCVWQVISDQN